MAEYSVKNKAKKWHARFYIENESGKKIQKGFVGTESKTETESMLRKAIADYEKKKPVVKSGGVTLGDMPDMRAGEKLKPGNLSNATVMRYMASIRKIKKYHIGNRRLKTVTTHHLQALIDFMSDEDIDLDRIPPPPLNKNIQQYCRILSVLLHFPKN